MSVGNGSSTAAANRVFPTTPVAWSQDIHRAPPHSVEAEQGVLGSMLIAPNETIPECQEKISTAEYFYVPAHQIIWHRLIEMFESKQAIDLLTFTQCVRDKNELEVLGGAAFVTSLFTFVPTAANVGYYIETLREKFILRGIIRWGTEAVRRAYEEQDEVNLLLDEVQAAITELALDRNTTSPLKHVRDVIPGVVEEMDSAYEHRGRPQGLATGFVDYDRMTSGLQASEMIVIAARPSMGKTALAMNIAEYVAVTRTEGKWEQKGVPVAVFSLETSAHRLVRRMVASRARVSIQKMRDGFFAERDFPALTAAAGKIQGASIYIDDTPGLRLFEFKARARWAAVKLGIKLIVIDYLQLMKSGSKRAEFSRVLELTEISAAIKEVGRELNIPIIVLAQLNREAEKQSNGRPRMMNLRECGAIEQDADVIALLYRREVYEEDEEVRAEMAGEAELIIAKQKDGPVGSIWLTFLKEFTRFEDRARMDGTAPTLYTNNPKKRQHAVEEDL